MLLERIHPFQQFRMPPSCVGGDNHVFLRILQKPDGFPLQPLAGPDQTARMAKPGGTAEHHGGVELLA